MRTTKNTWAATTVLLLTALLSACGQADGNGGGSGSDTVTPAAQATTQSSHLPQRVCPMGREAVHRWTKAGEPPLGCRVVTRDSAQRYGDDRRRPVG